MRRPIGAACAWLLLANPAIAQVDAGAAPGGDLIDAYLDLCLKRFPNDASVAEGARVRRLAALSLAEVKSFLHGDPGRGWIGTTTAGRIVLTLEDPPYHACAVRLFMQPTTALQTAYQLALTTWAANEKIGPLRAAPPLRREVNGATVEGAVQAVLTTDGKVRQTFIFIVTDYGKGRTEVRLARQDFPPR